MTKRDPQCDARVLVKSRGSHRCPLAGKHRHRTQAGDTFHLCGTHLRTIKRREQHGSDEELAARWRDG